MPAAVDRKRLSQGAEALTEDRRSGGVIGNHPGASGRSAALSAEAGVDVKLARAIFSLVFSLLDDLQCGYQRSQRIL